MEKNNSKKEAASSKKTKKTVDKPKSTDKKKMKPKNTSQTAKIETLQQELDESKDKYLRLYAEYENFRRRTAKEKLDLLNTAGSDILSAILPIVDDFDRAKQNEDKADLATMKEGMSLIHNKLINVLTQHELKDMAVKPGDDFDAEKHEAITKIPAPEKKLKGKIVDCIEKGYLVGDKVIRFAKVVIGD